MEKRFHLYGANPTSKVWFMKRFSRVDCFSGVDQNKYSLDMFTSSSLTVNLTEGAAACVALYLKCYVTRVKIYDKTSLQTLFFFSFFLTIWPPISTYIQKNAQFQLRQIDFNPFLCPHTEKAVPVRLYCV